jgi:glutathione S-transferase
MTRAILFSGTRNASSWAMRAWLALRASKFPFQEVIVDIRRPQRFANLDAIRAISPSVTVPVLLVQETAIFDSLAIMEFADDYADGRLLPQDPLARAEARSLMAWQHSGLSRICERISFESAFYPYKRELSPEEQCETSRLFQALELLLRKSGGPYLFAGVTLADFMLAPTAARLSRHRVDTSRWPLSGAWLQTLLGHELVTEWLSEADACPHIWSDDYLLPEVPLKLNRAAGADVDSPPECFARPAGVANAA